MTSLRSLTLFAVHGEESESVGFAESSIVCAGVECFIYRFVNDPTKKDLALVYVLPGHCTPLQRVIGGDRTLEGYYAGEGELDVVTESGEVLVYRYPSEHTRPVEVGKNCLMRWRAAESVSVTFYELCWPPYSDGRFENLD
jgi:hypothetical protein